MNTSDVVRRLARDTGANEELELEVYSALADMLPRDGRDYRVAFMYPEDGGRLTPTVRLVPLTPMGDDWCRHASAGLVSRMEDLRRAPRFKIPPLPEDGEDIPVDDLADADIDTGFEEQKGDSENGNKQ